MMMNPWKDVALLREPFPPALSTYPPLEEAQGSFEKISFDPLSVLLKGFDRQPLLLNRSLRPVKAEERFSLEPR
jgi:hypothetical protein